ncbi:sigma 54-interacting transcriptional regulator [Aneurinibacillus sp. BA2021]|nr:sigma 54-interacting transcriptional regulator [Aneurinibacillus sp. BA2021]
MQQAECELLLVTNQDDVVGYIDSRSLLTQLLCPEGTAQAIRYETNMLMVRDTEPVEFYHNVHFVLGKNEQGQIVGCATMEAVRHAVHALHLSQMRKIFASAGIGIVTTDTEFHITFINEKAEEIFGIPGSVLLYRNYKTLLRTSKDLEYVLEGKPLVSIASSFNSKAIIGNFSPLYENEQISGIVHVFYPRKQLEASVKELEFVRNLNEDLQALSASSNEQLVVIDEAGTILRLSGAFSPDIWLTQEPKDMIGTSVFRLEQEGIFPADIVKRCRKQKQKVTGVQETPRGRKLWTVAVPVLKEEKIEKIIIVLRDITDVSEYQIQPLPAANKNDAENKQLIYRSKIMEEVVEQAKRIAEVDSTVLLCGESGVGKEVFAQTIHAYSPRHAQPFVRVNCGAIPENLMESEFFGYEPGAFTGADRNGKPGLFELAHTGTIFLDEVGELPSSLQVKLLRVLQEREIRRVGGTHTIPIDVRIIAATNKDLRRMVQEKTFREDLYYRLHVIPIHLPPLRKRRADIIPLSLHFLELYNQKYSKEKQLAREAIGILEHYDWPGNIRELQNVLERLIVITPHDFIEDHDVLAALYGDVEKEQTEDDASEIAITTIMPLRDALEQVETQLLNLALTRYRTAAEAARALDISEATISRKIKRRLV